jgi:sulfate transport system permease protein
MWLLRQLRAVLAVPASWLWGRKLRLLVLLYLGLLIGLPVGYLFEQTFASGWGAVWRELTAPGAVAALELSAKVALFVVPINTFVGVVAGLLIARRRVVGGRVLELAFDAPMAISPVIVGVALFLAYAPRHSWFGPLIANNVVELIFTPYGIALATMVVTLPYVLRSVVPVLIEVGDTQEQAARTLGAGAMRRFFTITLPAIRWGLLFGVMLTLARALGEFGAVLIVSGNISGQTQTLPIYIYDSWDQYYDKLGSFAGAAELASISIVALIGLSILRSRERRLRVDLT